MLLTLRRAIVTLGPPDAGLTIRIQSLFLSQTYAT
jgi:hypothetical protein